MNSRPDSTSDSRTADERERYEQIIATISDAERVQIKRRVAARMDRNLKGRLDASDIVQETLAEACSRISEYLASPSVPFMQWLHALAEQNAVAAYRKHVLTQKRSTRREVDHGLSDDSSPAHRAVSDATDPGESYARAERREQLHAAISRLSPVSQQVVRMRFLEGRSLADIADELDMNVDAVAKRAMRSLVKLQSYAGDLGLGETGDLS